MRVVKRDESGPGTGCEPEPGPSPPICREISDARPVLPVPMPGDMCPVWAEMYGQDGLHTVAPTPHSDMQDARDALSDLHPGATVDELCDPAEIAECREWARTMPLEQIGA